MDNETKRRQDRLEQKKKMPRAHLSSLIKERRRNTHKRFHVEIDSFDHIEIDLTGIQGQLIINIEHCVWLKFGFDVEIYQCDDGGMEVRFSTLEDQIHFELKYG